MLPLSLLLLLLLLLYVLVMVVGFGSMAVVVVPVNHFSTCPPSLSSSLALLPSLLFLASVFVVALGIGLLVVVHGVDGEDDQPQRHGVVVAEIRVESSSWDSKLQWRANDADWDKMGG